jgi:hypothetical protein
MSRFLKRFFLFLVLSLGIASGADRLISHGLKSLKSGEFGTWSDIYHGRIDSELIVVGSSRAMVHVSPAILSQHLGVSVYNLGHNGQHFPMQRVRFQELLKFNRSPSWVVQTVDITSLHDRQTVFQYEQFLPWFDQSTLIDAVAHYEGFDLFDPWLPMYRYRGRGELALTGLSLALGWMTSDYDRNRGYMGRDLDWDGAFDDFAKLNAGGFNVPIDRAVESSMDEFLAQQTHDGIRWVMVFTPEYRPGQRLCRNRSDVINRLRTIAKRNGAVFLDYSEDPICLDKSLFYNSQHLNRRGAEQFSLNLANRLKTLGEAAGSEGGPPVSIPASQVPDALQ